jgi:hypothetical protein
VLKLKDLQECLNPDLDDKRKSRFELAFRSLDYQEDYCRYHYEQYNKEHNLFFAASEGKLNNEEILNPQYYRIAFEAHCFSFFRAFHALIESIPYLLNLLIEAEINSESRLSWNTIVTFCEKSKSYKNGVNRIKSLKNSDSYKELGHISNVSKHRRIVRIDSGIRSEHHKASLCKEDLDTQFRSYEIEKLMNTIFDELHPQAIELIRSFMHERN